MTSTEIWLRLIYVNDLYGDEMVRIAQRLAKAASIDFNALIDTGLRAKQARRFLSMTPREIEESLCWLAEPRHHLILATDACYPAQLRAIADYPGAIFIKGDPAVLAAHQLAVVGSRTHSWYGERWGRSLCEALAQCGLVITSGLALGIDSVAHRGALAVGGRTIAVLGNGLFTLHPKRHASLAEQIISEGGALVSEFALNTPPFPGNFPRRNRIISGLSRAVFVVEAALRSGSLVTTRCALEQGRDVFALPGPNGAPGSEGPHWLIQQGAYLVTSPEDILENFPGRLSAPQIQTEKTIYSPNQEEVALPFPELLANVGDEVTPVDVVAERAGQPVPVTVTQLLELELAGWIAAVPGGYVRLRRASHVRRTNVFV
ncbi:DNA-protecting protein DprA [Yokenella regensburgei]|uniref:DNA-protecting protein DprA n=1 Tax=Yokenella regensburgei TaxID=158877 RepID=UPI003F18C803